MNIEEEVRRKVSAKNRWHTKNRKLKLYGRTFAALIVDRLMKSFAPGTVKVTIEERNGKDALVFTWKEGSAFVYAY